MSVLSRGQAALTASTTHTIRWTVSARALGAVRPDLVGEAIDREDATLETSVEIGADGFHARVVVRHQARATTLEDIRGDVQRADAGGVALVHLDCEELVATLRPRGAEFETLYARLPLLARMGLAGGRYELFE